MKIKYIIFNTLLAFCLSLNAQNVNQDLKYQQKIFSNASNLDSLFYYSSRLEKSQDSCFKYEGKIHKAKFYYLNNNYSESEKIAFSISKNLQNKNSFCLIKIRIESLNRLFWIKKNQCEYNEAFKQLLKIKEEIKKIPKDEEYLKSLNLTLDVNIALIKSLLRHYEEGRSILKKHLWKGNFNTSKKYSEKLNQANILNLIAESYLKSSDNSKSRNLDSAAIYFKKAYNVAKTFNPPHKDSETLYQIRKTEVLIAKNKYKEALNLLRKFDSNSSKFNTENNINSLKAICFYGLNKSDSLIYYSRKFLIHQKKNSTSKNRLTVIYDILANQFHKDNKIDSAFKYSELTILEIKTLVKSENEVNKAHYLHDFKNAEDLNKIILKENKSNISVLIILGVILIIIALIIISFFYRKHKKSNIEIVKINEQLLEQTNTPKTEYNIDNELEKTILKGLINLENSTDFLDASFHINTLAKKLNTNTSYLSYTINEIKNKSFKQYITELRIEYLLKKLKEDKNYKKYTIKYLAEKIGYTNASAFTRAFKKYKGTTPSQFIKSLDND